MKKTLYSLLAYVLVFGQIAQAGSPVIWGGTRAKNLTSSGFLLSDNSAIDNDGQLNYIKNGHAETSVTGWAAYADAAGTAPVDCTGGSPTETVTRTTSSPLVGTGSVLLTKDAANRQGNGISYAFTIDPAFASQTLMLSFQGVDGGTYSSSDLGVYIYDVTGAALIVPSTTLVASGANNFQATWTATANTSYRLCIHTKTTSASAYTYKLDKVFVGPFVGSVVGNSNPTVQTFLTGSGTYTTPANILYLEVEMAGGGGGGGGGAANGSDGADSTFGSSLLTASKGSGGGGNGAIGGGAGGAATVTTSATVLQLVALTGGKGFGASNTATGSAPGGGGGANDLGGAGAPAGGGNTGNAGGTNTGAGGSGGGSTNQATDNASGGGGAGGYLKAIITSPSSTYAYAVGAGGAAGGATTNGKAGGAGGSGIIVVTEHYQLSIPALLTNPMTAQGDVIYGGSSGSPTRLAVGSRGKVLDSDGTNPQWFYPYGTATVGADANTSLTTSSNHYQTVPTSTARTYTLPSTAVIGELWVIENTGFNDLTFKSSDATTMTTANVAAGSAGDPTIQKGFVVFEATSATPTDPSGWRVVEVFERYAAITGTTGGAVSVAFTLRLTRHNRNNTCTYSSATATAGANSTITTGNVLPTRFYHASVTIWASAPVYPGGQIEIGIVSISTAGGMTFKKGVPANFAGGSGLTSSDTTEFASTSWVSDFTQ